jgi:hypothetical protein
MLRASPSCRYQSGNHTKREVLLALAGDAQTRRGERTALAAEQLRQRAADRNLNWDAMTDDERQALVDDFCSRLIVHASPSRPLPISQSFFAAWPTLPLDKPREIVYSSDRSRPTSAG